MTIYHRECGCPPFTLYRLNESDEEMRVLYRKCRFADFIHKLLNHKEVLYTWGQDANLSINGVKILGSFEAADVVIIPTDE